jgi:hypothetical protein
MRLRACSLSSSIGKCCLDNLRLGGAIRGISGTLGREGRGECCSYSKFFYVVAPACVGYGPSGWYP